MAIKISELVTISSVSDDDFFIVNDGDVNTRKTSFNSLAKRLVRTDQNSTINGNITLKGTLVADDITVAGNLIEIDTENNRIGLGTSEPQYTLDVRGSVGVGNGSALHFGDTTNAFSVAFRAPTLVRSTTYALPDVYPAVDNMLLASTTTGDMSWQPGLINPMTMTGDMLFRNTTGVTSRLPIGTFGQTLIVQADGVPNWQNPPQGFADPMTTAGDIITRNQLNQTTRLPVGDVGDGLLVGAGGTLEWGSVPSAAGGDNEEIQWNSNGALAGDPNFYYNTVTNTVTATNFLATNNFTVTGDLVFGDVAADNVSINGTIVTPLIPVVQNPGLDIGSNANRWGDLWMGSTLNFRDDLRTSSLKYSKDFGFDFGPTNPTVTPTILRLHDEQDSGSINIAAPLAANLTSYTITLPGAQGSAGTTLVNDGAGTLSWGPAGNVSLIVTSPPGGQFDSGTRGELAFDNNYIYLCAQDNIWIRSCHHTLVSLLANKHSIILLQFN